MAADFTLIAQQFGDDIDFFIRNESGELDDLTVYSDVRILVSTADFSSIVRDHPSTDPENITTNYSTGQITWRPSAENAVPVHGFYWISIIRQSANVKKPVRKFFLEIVREVISVG